ncbi:SLC13 family permease [Agaribacterium haliotis]|uniref:SLC13 family permease n=1 Tax=Agaribacterium haliotis TaxID=2013869 RepID=UPI000BB56438|nr:SLC13 family permease [Agaribacterium haliotis]
MDALLTLAVLACVLLALISNKVAADLVLMAAVTVLIISGVLSPAEALAGFANPGVITIATLYVVAAGLIETGAVQWLAHYVLGRPRSLRSAQQRLIFPTALLSAFTNNTAIVAMFTPAIQSWAERLKIPPSKLLIPLSYAAIIGGTCTIIGTSTNLIVHGLLIDNANIELGLFDIAIVGLPLCLAFALFMYVFGSKLLPSRGNTAEQLSEVRQYCVAFRVTEGPLVGRSIRNAGLRHLRAGYLIELQRNEQLHTAIDPSWNIEKHDILHFLGGPELAAELRNIRGLQPASLAVEKLAIANQQRRLVEVVLGPEFPALGKSVRESRFRSRFNAAILSISRNGKQLPGNVGEQHYKVGDTLLLETGDEFVDQYRFRKDFLLVSPLSDEGLSDFRKVPRAVGILLLMIASTSFGFTSILESVLLAAGAMLLTRCVGAAKARRQIDLQVLVVIAASFALGTAMNQSGAAAMIADTLMHDNLASPMLALVIIYLLTVVFTELMTNNAAAVLMFPIAQSFAEQLGVSIMPFAVVLMVAASASFITPLGYQTNLMVYGPGQYRYSDYVKIGTPLSLVIAALTLFLVPIIWPF